MSSPALAALLFRFAGLWLVWRGLAAACHLVITYRLTVSHLPPALQQRWFEGGVAYYKHDSYAGLPENWQVILPLASVLIYLLVGTLFLAKSKVLAKVICRGLEP